MTRILKLSVLASLLVFSSGVKAQVDPHFSQYYVYPSFLNPALTGAFDGDYRVSGIYRTQWGNISSPYTTPGLSAEINTNKNVNLGVSLLRQTAGDGGFTYTTAYGNFAYTGMKLGKGNFHRVVFGLQAGIIQRRFDPTKLTFGDQWNPVTGYTGTPSSEVITNPNNTSLDIGAGVLYYDAQPGKKSNLFGGYSASHITRPTDKFSAFGDARFPVRHTMHAGVRVALNNQFSITPHALYMKQGSASEKMVGAYGQYRTGVPDFELLFGANYRFKDAVSPYVGAYYKNMVLGVTYDINTSDLGKLVKGSNSFEITLSFIGRRKAQTPEAEFVCPRL